MNEWLRQLTVDVDDRLLDRQVTGPDGMPVGKVDDVELEPTEDGRYEITGLLLGSTALGERVRGLPGRWIERIGRWLHGSPHPRRIPAGQLLRVDPAVVVPEHIARDAVSPSEEWLRRTVITRIPGVSDARE